MGTFSMSEAACDRPTGGRKKALSAVAQLRAKASRDSSSGGGSATAVVAALAEAKDGAGGRDGITTSGGGASASAASAATGKAKKKKKSKLFINLANTNYDILGQVSKDLGMGVVRSSNIENCNIVWYDSFPGLDPLTRLKPWQRCNHFPGTGEITRKDNLARNINRLQRICPADFKFAPRSWILPADGSAFRQYASDSRKRGKTKTFIYKPIAGARGEGIFLTQDASTVPTDKSLLVQEYLPKPFLIDGFKFDLRLYVLVLSCRPLRILMYRDGLVRLSTEPYRAPTSKNISERCMHLTNYSVNKRSDEFEKTDEAGTGSKRSLAWLLETLRTGGHDTTRMWERIGEVVVKTMIAALPHVTHGYTLSRKKPTDGSVHPPLHEIPEPSVCFEILGFDIFLDRKLRPYIIEVNRAPSFSCDSEVDLTIKRGVLTSAFKLLSLKVSDKRKGDAKAREKAQSRLFASPARARTASTSGRSTSGSGNNDGGGGRGWDGGDSGNNSGGGGTSKSNDLKCNTERLAREMSEAETKAKQRAKEYEEWAEKRDRRERLHAGEYDLIFPPRDPDKLSYYEQLIDRAHEATRTAVGTARHQVAARQAPGRTILIPMDESAATARVAGSTVNDSTIATAAMVLANGSTTEAAYGGSGGSGGAAGSGGGAAGTAGIGRRQIGGGPRADYDRVRQEEVRQTQFAQELEGIQITLPSADGDREGAAEAEADAGVAQILENWNFHRSRVAAYWLRMLSAQRRYQVVEVVKKSATELVRAIWTKRDLMSVRSYRLLTRLCDQLTFNAGMGLWNCFDLPDESWESVGPLVAFGQISTTEQVACLSVVRLAKRCLLLMYYAAVARGDVERFMQHTHEKKKHSETNSISGGHRITERATTTTKIVQPAAAPPGRQALRTKTFSFGDVTKLGV